MNSSIVYSVYNSMKVHENPIYKEKSTESFKTGKYLSFCRKGVKSWILAYLSLMRSFQSSLCILSATAAK